MREDAYVAGKGIVSTASSRPRVRLRFLARFNPSKGEISDHLRHTAVSFLPMDAIGDDGTFSLDATRELSAVEQGYTFFRDGDVLIAKITPCFENGKGALVSGLLGGIGFGTTELIVVRPDPSRVSGAFLQWVFSSKHFRNAATAAMYGAGGQKRVPDEFVRDFPLMLPPPAEQAAIVAFLDRETGRIDALVAEQERLIALLKEKRQAVISHAVTRGLNPNVPMKDSGVAWLGELPAHWDVKRLRFLCHIGTGDADTADSLEDGAYHFFVRSPVVERIDDHTHDCEAVLTAGDGAGVGKVFHYFKGKFRAHQRVYIFSDFLEILGKFFYLYIREMFAKVVLEGTAKSTVESLRRPMIADFWVTIPPRTEQRKILLAMQIASTQTDTLVAEATRAIVLLRERRAALISAAVTGRIDVRDAMPEAQRAT